MFVSFIKVRRFKVLVEPKIKHEKIEACIAVVDVEEILEPSKIYWILAHAHVNFSGFMVVSDLAVK